MAARTTVADRFKLVAGKFSIFSTAITEVTGVNGILEELIVNDLALVKEFGEPGNPIVELHTQNFKQEVSEAVISSKGVIRTIKSVARYASNANHIQRIKEDLNIPQLQGETSCQNLRHYLTVLSRRISNCHKRMKVIRPIYEKVHNVILQHVQPRPGPKGVCRCSFCPTDCGKNGRHCCSGYTVSSVDQVHTITSSVLVVAS
jgi:hypothetical protein